MNRKDFLGKTNTALNELYFIAIAKECKGDINCINGAMINAEVDARTLGFWIWDIPNNVEIYSPKFRKTLGFKDESDFPNSPESWQNQISRKGKEKAMEAFELHAKSKGKHPYCLPVTYWRKGTGTVDLICHGKIISWTEDGLPSVMIGVHMRPDGLFDQ